MKSKSRGFFHFGKHSKEETESNLHRDKEINKTNQQDDNTLKQRQDGLDEYDESRQQFMTNRIWDQSPRDHDNPNQIQELREADQKFWSNDLDEAIALYLSAIPIAQDKLSHCDADTTVGDINVKISIILQGRGESQSAMEHLRKAKDIYQNAYKDANKSDDNFRKVMAEKIIEVTNRIANVNVEMGEMDEASKVHEDIVESCKTYFPKDVLRLSNALNDYANFLSICKNDHDGALEKLKQALKILFQANHGNMNAHSAPTLNNMGKIYMRRTEPFQGLEVQKDAKKAEVCFARAVQLYQMSMVHSGNEKVTETLYNMVQAREWQSGKGKGILKNVRFDPKPIERQYTAAEIFMSIDDESVDDYDDDDYTYDSTVATDPALFDLGFLGCFSSGKNIKVDEKETVQNQKQSSKQSMDQGDDEKKKEMHSSHQEDMDSITKETKINQKTNMQVRDKRLQDKQDQQQQENQQPQETSSPTTPLNGSIQQYDEENSDDGTSPPLSADFFLSL